MPVESNHYLLDIFDEPFNPEEVLRLIRPKHHFLTLEAVGLKDNTLNTLLQGLDDLRERYTNPVDGRRWGISRIALTADSITDVELSAVLGYASRDDRMRTVSVEDTSLELGAHLGDIHRSLNASSISALRLGRNPRLHAAGVSQLLRDLSSSTLRELRINHCGLGPAIADAVIAYLSASRSRHLTRLNLQGNPIGMPAVHRIIDSIEARNFTLCDLDIQFGDIHTYDLQYDENESSCTPEEWVAAKADYDRLLRCLERNRALDQRVSLAARRCLPIARIILNDRSLLAVRISARQTANQRRQIERATGLAVFRLMDLPLDIINLVVRHTSGDVPALSDAQFARVRMEAEGKGELNEAMGQAWKAKLKADIVKLQDQARRDWLDRHGLDRWDSEIGR